MKVRTDSLPEALQEVALIDAPTCAAPGGACVAWWNNEVAAGRAPKPAIQRPRFTRWRLSDVRKFWLDLANAQAGQPNSQMTEQARRASVAARSPEAKAKSQATKAANRAARNQTAGA